MDDVLTRAVLDFQLGKTGIDGVRNLILLEAFHHLNRYRRKGEDEISEFLLVFHGRIEGIMRRFQCQGLPFRHFLLRTLRWQWNSFRTERSKERRRAWLAADSGLGAVDPEMLAEPGTWDVGKAVPLSLASVKRLVLLALKASPYLDEAQLEAICHRTGVELSWLQACQHRLKIATVRHRARREVLIEKRGDAYYKRLLAEDDARREVDPERRQVHERRAGLYRSRLVSLSRQQAVMSTAPTHLALSKLLGMPKGSIDSSLHHLKKELSTVYISAHDRASGDEQRAQEN